MSEMVLCEKSDLVAIADAVRAVTGSSESFNVKDLSLAAGTAISSGGAAQDLPMVFLSGTLPTTKDAVTMGFHFVSRSQNIQGYCEIKCQGTSSMAYPKKNFTIKTYADEALTEKIKFNFSEWGEQQKYCYKANWIDLTHSRNVVSAKLWGDTVKSRAGYAALPEELRTSPNQGAVDGFFVKVYANGIYQGRYTLNIPKDAWMANMDAALDNHCILCGENYGSGCFRGEAIIDGSDWSDEIHEAVPASIKTRWNEIINFVRTSSDAEFRANLGQYFNVESLIDYDIFMLICCGLDGMGKNQLYFTYDGVQWIASAYDLDSTWGLFPDGSKIVAADYSRYLYEDYAFDREGNLLYYRLEKLFPEEIKARYAELKSGALSIGNIISKFEYFMSVCSRDLVAEDYASTTANGAFVDIPSRGTNNIQQIRSFVAARYSYCDEYISLLGTGVVKAAKISLNTDTLSIEDMGHTNTLSAIIVPSFATEEVVWTTSDAGVATVVDGVVTPVGGGSCSISATIGNLTASCSVLVGGSLTDEFGTLAYKLAAPITFNGNTMPINTRWAPYDDTSKDWTVAIKYSNDIDASEALAYQASLCHMQTGDNTGTTSLWLFTFTNSWEPHDVNFIVGNGNYEYHQSGHGNQVSTDGYHYAIVTKQGNMVTHYIDGHLISGQSWERAFNHTSTMPLYIGGPADRSGLSGVIADVRIYEQCLSQENVVALTNAMKNNA